MLEFEELCFRTGTLQLAQLPDGKWSVCSSGARPEQAGEAAIIDQLRREIHDAMQR